MRLKIYRAASMAEAMTHLRAEFGPDAMILSSRPVKGGVEITAGLDPDEPAPEPARRLLGPDPGRRALLAYHAIPPGIAARLHRADLAQGLTDMLSFEEISTAVPLLFAGPPGAGKTLTTARLATRLVMAGEQPMVITADGRRAGATEQLAAFTRLLNVNLTVATHPVTLGRTLTRRPPGAPVLIDAPGCDPFDPIQLQELAALAATAGARIVLVLPAGLDPMEAEDIAAAFAGIGATQMIPTRLDLTRRLGSILAAAQAGRLALIAAGTGPGAADGLSPLTAAQLAARLQRELPAAAVRPPPSPLPSLLVASAELFP